MVMVMVMGMTMLMKMTMTDDDHGHVCSPVVVIAGLFPGRRRPLDQSSRPFGGWLPVSSCTDDSWQSSLGSKEMGQSCPSNTV